MFFAPTNPDKVRAQQLYEARRLHLEHAVAAEYHKAMQDMLLQRIQRLEALAAAPTITAAS